MLDDLQIIYGQDKDWGEWWEKVPALQFPSSWSIQITPPFTGALVRFRVHLDGACVSVYLDVHQRLGCWNGPYWEIYPYEDDTWRCDMDETGELIKAIAQSLNEQIEGKK